MFVTCYHWSPAARICVDGKHGHFYYKIPLKNSYEQAEGVEATPPAVETGHYLIEWDRTKKRIASIFCLRISVVASFNFYHKPEAGIDGRPGRRIDITTLKIHPFKVNENACD